MENGSLAHALAGEKTLGNRAMYSLCDVKPTPALSLIDKKAVLRTSPKRHEVSVRIQRLLEE
jgi:hypothetical protein